MLTLWGASQYSSSAFWLLTVFSGWLTLLMWLADLVPLWVHRQYRISLANGTTVQFTVKGGSWEAEKLFWWAEGEAGFWIKHVRDISDPVSFVDLSDLSVHPWNGQTFKWTPPSWERIDYRLDSRFACARRHQAGVKV